MVLGAINTNTKPIGIVAQNEFDFSPLEQRVQTLEQRQRYLMIALVLLALYTIYKNN